MRLPDSEQSALCLNQACQIEAKSHPSHPITSKEKPRSISTPSSSYPPRHHYTPSLSLPIIAANGTTIGGGGPGYPFPLPFPFLLLLLLLLLPVVVVVLVEDEDVLYAFRRLRAGMLAKIMRAVRRRAVAIMEAAMMADLSIAE